MWSGRSPGPTPSQFLLRREGICDRLAPGSFLSFLAPCGPICITRISEEWAYRSADLLDDVGPVAPPGPTTPRREVLAWPPANRRRPERYCWSIVTRLGVALRQNAGLEC